MIEHAAFALPIFLLIMAVLFLWSVVGARGRWWLKLLFISTIPLSTVAVWSSLHSYLGWPTNEKLPAKFLLYGAVIDEPELRSGDPGAIFLLVRTNKNPVIPFGDVFGYRNNPKTPRTYRLPYSRNLHEQIARMQGEFRSGRPVGVQGDGGFGDSPYGNSGGELKLYVLPPVRLPPKDPQQQ